MQSSIKTQTEEMLIGNKRTKKQYHGNSKTKRSEDGPIIPRGVEMFTPEAMYEYKRPKKVEMIATTKGQWMDVCDSNSKFEFLRDYHKYRFTLGGVFLILTGLRSHESTPIVAFDGTARNKNRERYLTCAEVKEHLLEEKFKKKLAELEEEQKQWSRVCESNKEELDFLKDYYGASFIEIFDVIKEKCVFFKIEKDKEDEWQVFYKTYDYLSDVTGNSFNLIGCSSLRDVRTQVHQNRLTLRKNKILLGQKQIEMEPGKKYGSIWGNFFYKKKDGKYEEIKFNNNKSVCKFPCIKEYDKGKKGRGTAKLSFPSMSLPLFAYFKYKKDDDRNVDQLTSVLASNFHLLKMI